MQFSDVFPQHRWFALQEQIYRTTEDDVEQALVKQRRSVADFCCLVSPAARPYLEQMAKQSSAITRKRFGRTMQLFIPLYLSNECTNICTYCGFSVNNPIERKTLNNREILREIEVIKAMGFDHILIVTGESSRVVGAEYLENALQLIRPHFSNISIEVQPLETSVYEKLRTVGLHGVLVYQETYNEDAYRRHHPRGKKANYHYRLATPERLGAAGVHKIGLGALLGLSDWRTDAASVALHLEFLQQRFWKSRYSISFPRLRPAAGVTDYGVALEEMDLAQLIFAYRLFNEQVELSLSTRERSFFRDHMIPLGITAMSAGSRTEPGGYAIQSGALKQFETDDTRDPQTVAAAIRGAGYEPVWKDWDLSFDGNGHDLSL